MPPQKRGAMAKTKSTMATTRASVPDTITNSRGKEFETTAALSRPRRESAILPSTAADKKSVTPATKNAAATKKATTVTPTKKRGRPVKVSVDEEGPRKRGRPSKKTADEEEEDDFAEEEDEQPVKQKVATPRARGRPPGKAAAAKAAAPEAATKATPQTLKQRGRPSKADNAAAKAEAEGGAETVIEDQVPPSKKRGRPSKDDIATAKAAEIGAAEDGEEGEAPPPRKRGRPSKMIKDAVPEDETPPPKKRGRSPRGGETTKISGDDDAAADQLEDELVDDTAEQAKIKPSTAREKGKGKGKSAQADLTPHEEEKVNAGEDLEQVSSGKQYWLMKAEQEDREEPLANGEMFNTKFTIDDLKSKGGPEPWDGVRNPTAAKNMRTMKKGDLAFFYASGGKSGRKPGIVGIMEVVKESEPDQTAWDEGAYGYVEDEKARSKWCVVHVEYRNKLSSPVHLSELQKYMEGSGVLSKMQVLKQSRLSVTKVTEAEWTFINEQLIEGFEEQSDALPGAGSSPTNGKSNNTPTAEEESSIITTEQRDGEVVENESSLKESELSSGVLPAGLALPTIEGEIPSTDTIFPADIYQTSRPASRGGSRASTVKPRTTVSRQGSRDPPIKPKTTTSRQSSRASSVTSSLVPPVTNGRGRSRTPKSRAGDVAPTNAEMQTIGEGDE